MLATQLGSAWNTATTDVRLKKRIVRALIEKIIATIDEKENKVNLAIHWKGGVHSELVAPRRRPCQNRSHTSTDIVEAVQILSRVCSDGTITRCLNRVCMLTGRNNRWTIERLRALRSRHKILMHNEQRQREQGWMNLTQSSAYLGISQKTLRNAVELGLVTALHPLPIGPYIFKKTDLDGPNAREVVRRAHNHSQKLFTGPLPGQQKLIITNI